MTMKYRRALIDWLSDACNKLSLNLDVFTKAVLIFDKAASSFNQVKYSFDDLFLLSITSLLLAMKLSSRRKISMDMASKHISKQKFDRTQLLRSEISVLKLLKFKFPSAESFSDYSLAVLNEVYSECFLSKLVKTANISHSKQKLHNLAMTVFKIAQLDYKGLNKESQVNLDISIVFTCISSIQHLLDTKTKSNVYKKVAKMIKEAECSYEKLHSISKRLTLIIQNILGADYLNCSHIKGELEINLKELM